MTEQSVYNLFNLPKKRDGSEGICVTTNGMIRKDGRAVMGAGVAKAFRDRYEGLDYTLAKSLRENGNVVSDLGIKEGYHIISFPTKNNWKDNSDINLIEQSAKQLVQLADKLNLTTVWLPQPGCTNGHLDWETVKKVIEPYLDDRFIVTSRPQPTYSYDKNDTEIER